MDKHEFLKHERDSIAKYINPKYRTKEKIQHSISPTKIFHLEISQYKDKGINENGITYEQSYMNCIVFKENKNIFSINGTINFYSEWIERGNKEAYLLSTEYYQGYGILNLNTIEYNFFLPDEAINGKGYIWAEGHLSPDKMKIAIEGCIWAYPYQIKIYDIQNAMYLPYGLLFETTIDEEYSEVIGWKDNNHFSYKNEYGKELTIRI